MNKEQREDRDLQLQWGFVIVAALLAVILGVFVNALYDLLVEVYSEWYILILFGFLSFLFVDILSYFFFNLQEARKNPEEPYRSFLMRYIKMRLRYFWRRTKSVFKK